jgi:DNA-binding sugar fermentation-stimulating protein
MEKIVRLVFVWKKTWIEVKNITFKKKGLAEFSDLTSQRETKQYIEIKDLLINRDKVIIINLLKEIIVNTSY